MPTWVFGLGILWLMGQIATDLVRATPFSDYIRGWSKIIFTLLNLMMLFLLLDGRRRRLFLFALGLSSGSILAFYIRPDVFAERDPWKFGIAFPVTFALVLLASTWRVGRHRYLPPSILGLAAGLNLIQGFRSLAGVCFLASIYLATAPRRHGFNRQQDWVQKDRRESNSLGRRKLRAGVVVSLAIIGFVGLYNYAASRGILGETAQRKFAVQSQGAFGVFLGGRSDALVSIRAISESPILGHGSWAKDPKYVSLLASQLQRYGYAPLQSGSALIPTHSHLLGAWVESGILGGIFWVAVLVLPIRTLLRWHEMRDSLSPIVVFVAFSLLWDIFFSPYGAERRLIIPFNMVVLTFALQGFVGKHQSLAKIPRFRTCD